MKNLEQGSLQRSFSHIYLESAVRNDSATAQILERFPRAQVVEIDDYKHIFNQSHQNFRVQKLSPKLILARKKNNFLYPGSSVTPAFGNKNFFYNSLVLNCIYDCDYCYLQGMYRSANIVIFVNSDDFLEETSKKLEELGSLYLCISYDTDLLLFESIYPYCRLWHEFAAANPNITIELRTKSANFAALRNLPALKNYILAWTISPDSVIHRHENGAASLKARLAAIKEAIDKGWQVRLCFDPLLAVDNWRETYSEFFEQVFQIIPASGVRDVSVGVFRISPSYFRRIKQVRSDSLIMYSNFDTKSELVTYEEETKSALQSHAVEGLARYVERGSIFLI